MAVSYDKLLHLLIDRQMSNAELIKRAGFSGNVMTQVKRRKYISLDSTNRICVDKNPVGSKRFKRLDRSKGAIREKVLDAMTIDEINHIFDTDGEYL